MIVIVGGTGQLGRVLVRRFVGGSGVSNGAANGVRVMSRSVSRSTTATEIEMLAGDVRDDAAVRRAVRDATVVVSLVHGLLDPGRHALQDVDVDGNARLAEASSRVGARFVMMSVLDAGPDAGATFFRTKWAAEQRVRSIEPDATVLRAPAFVETWAQVVRETRNRSGRPLVLGHGDNPVNMVSVQDVADTLLTLVYDAGDATGSTLRIEGPQNVTVTDLTRQVQRVDGLTAEPRHLPVVALELMARQPLVPKQARLAGVALAMERLDQACDPTRPLGPDERRGETTVAEVLAASSG